MTDPTHAQLRDAMLESLRSPSDSRRHAIVSEVLQIFPFEDLPSPGNARAWDLKDWVRWFDDHGFEQRPESAHSVPFHHPRLRVVSSVPKTSSDWRWSMNQASDLRSMVRTAFHSWEPILVSALTMLAEGGVETDREPLEYLRVLVQQYIDNPEDFTKALAMSAEMLRKRDRGVVAVSAREVRSVLNKLESEFQISYRAALTAVMDDENNVESALLRVRGPQDCELPAVLLASLRDTLDTKRAVAHAERERKQAEREQERAERDAARATAATPAGKLRAQVVMVRNALLSNHANALRQLSEAITRMGHLGHAIKDLEIDVPQDIDLAVVAPARIAELEAEVAAHETEIAQHLQTIAELRVIAKERDELLATPDVRVAFDRFLADAERLLQEDNFMRLAGNIAKLLARITQERAALALPTTKDIGGASVATSAGT
jgi:hypothetical protein